MTALHSMEAKKKAYPKPAAGETLHVVQITDIHLFASPEQRLHDVDTGKSLARVIDAIAANESPDLLLVTGDLAQDESGEAYDRITAALAPFPTPALALAGNHDNFGVMTGRFAGTRISLDKQNDIGGWRIVQLHSPVAGETWGRLADAELEWLDEALATDRPILICLHHPPVAVGSRWLDTIGLTNAQAFYDVIDRHDSVRIVLAGHVHQEMQGMRGNVCYYTTPSTSVQFQPRSEQPAMDALAPGYRRLNLQPDGRFDSAVIRVPIDRP
jgi:Icc protein